ncbi:MAG: carotenoid biosynthesis protein [Cytophagales bacterium]|nr:carotenoid biosynthesis protein [Cytophagales bacterium]
MERKSNKLIISIVVLIFFDAVGLVGYTFVPLGTLFMLLTPYYILLSAAFVFFHEMKFTLYNVLYLSAIFFAGLAVEYLGVSTGVLFGQYYYGNTLGIKLLDVPVVMGINWVLLIYCTHICIQNTFIKHSIIKACVGASILTLLDFFIEPNAILYDYWHWSGNNVPFYNYFCWFAVSFVFLFCALKLKISFQNNIAIPFLAMRFVFFILLYIWQQM